MSDHTTPHGDRIYVEWADHNVGITCRCGYEDLDSLSADPYESGGLHTVACPICGRVFEAYPEVTVRLIIDGKHEVTL